MAGLMNHEIMPCRTLGYSSIVLVFQLAMAVRHQDPHETFMAYIVMAYIVMAYIVMAGCGVPGPARIGDAVPASEVRHVVKPAEGPAPHPYRPNVPRVLQWQVHRYPPISMDGYIDGSMDRWIDGSMDRRMDRLHP